MEFSLEARSYTTEEAHLDLPTAILAREEIEILLSRVGCFGAQVAYDNARFNIVLPDYVFGMSPTPELREPVKLALIQVEARIDDLRKIMEASVHDLLSASEVQFDDFPIPKENPNFCRVVKLFDVVKHWSKMNPQAADILVLEQAFQVWIIGGIADPQKNQKIRKDIDLLFLASEPHIPEAQALLEFLWNKVRLPDEQKGEGIDILLRKQVQGPSLFITPWIRKVLAEKTFEFDPKDFPIVFDKDKWFGEFMRGIAAK